MSNLQKNDVYKLSVDQSNMLALKIFLTAIRAGKNTATEKEIVDSKMFINNLESLSKELRGKPV